MPWPFLGTEPNPVTNCSGHALDGARPACSNILHTAMPWPWPLYFVWEHLQMSRWTESDAPATVNLEYKDKVKPQKKGSQANLATSQVLFSLTVSNCQYLSWISSLIIILNSNLGLDCNYMEQLGLQLPTAFRPAASKFCLSGQHSRWELTMISTSSAVSVTNSELFFPVG